MNTKGKDRINKLNKMDFVGGILQYFKTRRRTHFNFFIIFLVNVQKSQFCLNYFEYI